MESQERIQIFPDVDILHKCFPSFGGNASVVSKLLKNSPHFIANERYQKIAKILSDYNFNEKTYIDTFSMAVQHIQAMYEYSKNPTNIAEDKEYYDFWAEMYELKKKLQKHKVTGIKFYFQVEKGIKPLSVLMKTEKFINKAMNAIQEKINIVKVPDEFYEQEKRKKGRPERPMDRMIFREVRNGLKTFFQTDERLNEIEKNEKFFFMGKLFAIAGYFPEEDYYKQYPEKGYKSYRDFLIKRIKSR